MSVLIIHPSTEIPVVWSENSESEKILRVPNVLGTKAGHKYTSHKMSRKRKENGQKKKTKKNEEKKKLVKPQN